MKFIASPTRLALALAGACAIALSLTGAEAAILPVSNASGQTPDVQLAAGDCGAGFHRDATGMCVVSRVHRRSCQPGLHAVPAMNGNGFRCIPN
jgi:hypothetical protein